MITHFHFKTMLLALIITGSLSVLSGQKADIDPHYISVSTVNFPLNYIPVEDRTYSVKSYGDIRYAGPGFDDQITIYGWKKVEKDGTLDIRPRIDNFVQGRGVQNSRRIETKDKDGKVTSSKLYYTNTVENGGSGTLFVYGQKNEMPPFNVPTKNRKEKEPTKQEKAIASNPFLKGVETKVDDMAASKDGSGSPKLLAYQKSLSNTYSYSSSENASSAAAYKEFNTNVNAQTAQHEKNFRSHCQDFTNTFLNNEYGYKPVNRTVKFRKLDTDDHPEHDLYKSATEALKLILGKLRYNQPTDQIAKDLQPVLDYFDEVVDKYKNQGDKGQRRLRAATLYNLARAYQCLDQHEKALSYAQIMIDKKLEEDEGEKIIKECNEIMYGLAFHHMKSRQIIPQDEQGKKDEVGEEKVDERP